MWSLKLRSAITLSSVSGKILEKNVIQKQENNLAHVNYNFATILEVPAMCSTALTEKIEYYVSKQISGIIMFY